MDAEPTTRSRTFTWEDPMPPLAASARMSGIEYLRALRDRGLPGPPISQLMDFDIVEVSEDEVVFECTPGEHHYNPLGMVHGGLACTLRARGRVVKGGQRVIFADGVVEDAAGRALATATSSLLVLQR